MTDSTDVANITPEEREARGSLPVAVGRRHLLRGAVGSVPVVLTLVSRPVIAGGSSAACRTASAFGSINASRPGGTVYCSGRTPGYWKTHTNWPSPYKASGSQASQFNAVFGSAGGYPGMSLLAVLGLMSGGKDALARHIVAALLNAAQGLTPATILSTTLVKAIWTSYVTKGYYSPTAGVNWNADQIITWLQSTMPA